MLTCTWVVVLGVVRRGLDSGCILKEEPIGFFDGADVV